MVRSTKRTRVKKTSSRWLAAREARSFDKVTEDFFRAEGRPPPVVTPLPEAPTSLSPVARDAEPELAFLEPEPVTLRAPRRRLGRHVAVVMGLASFLCVAALGRAAMAPRPRAEPVRVAVAAALVPPIAVSEREEIPLPSPVVVDPEPPAAPAPSSGVALATRERARAALEAGRLTQATTLAAEATELAPDDAEAWLLLGAAQMEAGKDAEARAAFAACVAKARRGPVGECRSFAR